MSFLFQVIGVIFELVGDCSVPRCFSLENCCATSEKHLGPKDHLRFTQKPKHTNMHGAELFLSLISAITDISACFQENFLKIKIFLDILLSPFLYSSLCEHFDQWKHSFFVRSDKCESTYVLTSVSLHALEKMRLHLRPKYRRSL